MMKKRKTKRTRKRKEEKEKNNAFAISTAYFDFPVNQGFMSRCDKGATSRRLLWRSMYV